MLRLNHLGHPSAHLIPKVYCAAIGLRAEYRAEYSAGVLSNLMSVDAARVADRCAYSRAGPALPLT